jgi:hypothetical protein
MYKIGTIGWIVIAVLVILVLIWITHSAYTRGYMPEGVFKDTYESMIVSAHRSYDKYIESPANLWTRSIGYENDEPVQLAIAKATKLEEMHHANSSRLATTAADAANNSFILAELNRYNVAPNADDDTTRQNALDQADIMYRRTLSRIRNNTLTVARDDDHTEAILERINEYATTVNDNLFHPVIEQTRAGVRAARVQLADKKNKSVYFEPKPIRNDPQNVHDTELTHDIKVKYNKIIEKNKEDAASIGTYNYKQPTFADIRIELNRADLSETDRENAFHILNIIAGGSSITALNTTEDKVLLEIWKRIHSPENQDNRENLKNSLWQSLSSGMEKNYNGEYRSVCTSGRTSRIVDSLTLMDNDDSLAKPLQTVETLRNEILSKSYVILQTALKDSPVSAVYNGTEPETDENRQALVEFKNFVKQNIADTIHRDYPDAKPDTLDNIIKDAQAGVEI